MFERFTERARQVIVHGQAAARELQHGYIGTEHILLGLMGTEDDIASRALRSLGITEDAVRAEVVRAVGADDAGSSRLPFTPQAKKTLELALREALDLGHNYIGGEHILLGLVRDADAGGSRILAGLGADAETVRHEVMGMLSGRVDHATGPVEPTSAIDRQLAEMSDAALDAAIDILLAERDRRRRESGS